MRKVIQKMIDDMYFLNKMNMSKHWNIGNCRAKGMLWQLQKLEFY